MLLSSVNEQRSKLMPKKKFAFTSRRKDVAKDSTVQPVAMVLEDKQQSKLRLCLCQRIIFNIPAVCKAGGTETYTHCPCMELLYS